MNIFLSYAKEDGAIVKEFHDHLKALGFDPWMDQERLLPGQAWEREIDKALKDANVIILFMSPRSVNKRSFVTREANAAVANLRYKKVDDIYIIPVLIEACDVPQEISERAQYIEISAPGAKSKIVAAIKRAAEQQDIALTKGAELGPYQVKSHTYEEVKAGRPGHDISLDYPEFISEQYPEAAQALSAFFQGRSAKTFLDSRSKPWEQDPELHPEPEAEFNLFHANGQWEEFSVVSATDHLVSVYFSCSWYGAGAAHGHEYHEGFNFSIIDGKLYPFDLMDLFTNGKRAAETLSAVSRNLLAREYWTRSGGEDIQADESWHKTFLESTEADLENFKSFTVGDGKLIFYFAPCRVGPYALGSFVIDVPFYDLREVLVRGSASPLLL